MIIENMNTKEQWNSIVIHLTRSEADELRDAIEAILSSPAGTRHEHVPSEDYQREITVILQEEEQGK